MVSDLIVQLAPIASFLLVFTFVFAILEKTKILSEAKIIHFLISFIVAILFASTKNIPKYVSIVIPLFGILILTLVFTLILTTFVGIKINKNIGIAFATITLFIFLISAFGIFANSLFESINQILFTAHAFPQATNLIIFTTITIPAIWIVVKS